MKATMVVVGLAVVLCLACECALAQGESERPAALELLGAGPATIFPFDGDRDAFAAVGLTLQAFPIAEPEHLTLGTVPQYLAASVAVDVLWSTADVDDAMVGVSLRLYETETRVPVRLGITRPSGVGWSGYVKIDLPLG